MFLELKILVETSVLSIKCKNHCLIFATPYQRAPKVFSAPLQRMGSLRDQNLQAAD